MISSNYREGLVSKSFTSTFFSWHQVKLGSIGAKSYVPSGLSPAQYDKIRKAEAAKKEANYKRNVQKAGKFLGYDEFYLKRGTDLNGAWKKSPTLGHRMAKLKYEIDSSNTKQYDGIKK